MSNCLGLKWFPSYMQDGQPNHNLLNLEIFIIKLMKMYLKKFLKIFRKIFKIFKIFERHRLPRFYNFTIWRKIDLGNYKKNKFKCWIWIKYFSYKIDLFLMLFAMLSDSFGTIDQRMRDKNLTNVGFLAPCVHKSH